MRQIIWTMAILGGSLWIATVAFFASTDIPFLNLDEQQKLKEGKSFWEWPSTYGPLAMHYVEKGKGDKHVLLLEFVENQ